GQGAHNTVDETPPTIRLTTAQLESAFIKQFPRVLECSRLNTSALGYEAIVEVYRALDPITFGALDKAGAKEVLAVMGRMGKLKDCYIRDDSVQGLQIKGGSLLKAVQNMEDEALIAKEVIQFIWPAPEADTEGTSYTHLLARLKECRPAIFGSWDVARLKGAFQRIDEFSPINDARVLEHGLGRVLLVPYEQLQRRGIVKEDGGENQLTDHFDPETDRIFREHFAVLCSKYSLQSYTPINAGNVLKSLMNNWPDCYVTWNATGVAHAVNRMFADTEGN
ncbi:MAG: hypothetical protein K8953_00190, partial [Proteobacteria bacterium]|nr:hypothetical protein [Pseudomonadota bacterium]